MNENKPAEPGQRLRIAMLSIHSSPLGPLGTKDTGGMSVYIRELARLLGREGHSVDIYTYHPGSGQEVDLYPNVRLVHLRRPSQKVVEKEYLPAQLSTIFERLEKHRLTKKRTYDLIHSHYWLSGVVGAMAQTRWRRPHVIMFHTLGVLKNNTVPDEKEPDLRIAHERWLAKAADCIIAPTQKERDNLVNHYHAPQDRIVTIPCGVDIEHFRPLKKAMVRETLAISQSDRVVLFVGRFAPLKGIDLLIGATADLLPRFPDLRLLVVGGDGADSPYARKLARLARRLDIASRITFAGRVDQTRLPLYYCSADVLAMPSHYESFGLVMLEALACGTPVAATPVGGVENIVKQGVNGQIIARPNRRCVGAGVARALAWLGAADGSLSDSVRDTVKPYAWSNVAERMARTYATLLNSHDPRRAPGSYAVHGIGPK